MRRPWTAAERRILRAKYARLGPRGCAKLLRRSKNSVAHQARVMRLRTDRFWTAEEQQFVSEHYGKMPTVQIAEHLGCTVDAIHNQADRLGLMRRRPKRNQRELERFIRRYHRRGWCDPEIAAAWRDAHPGDGIDRHMIGDIRQRLGLASNRGSEHYRRRVAARTQQQLREAGLPSIGWLRAKAHRDFCAGRGWPQIVRPRLAQILEQLYQFGPQSRKQLAAAIGLAWKGSRKSLHGNGPGGSYMAEGMRLGLIVRLPGKVNTARRGQGVYLYAIAPGVQRSLPA